MASFELTEGMIQSLDLAAGIYERGRGYFQQGMVLSLTQRGDTLLAEVEGSDDEPYTVSVRVSDGQIVTTDCSCPYTEEWGGVCKHVVAALLTALHRPREIEQRTPVAELIAGLDADQLRQLVQRLAERTPAVTETIEDLLRWRR